MTKEKREKIRRENIDRPGEDAVCCSACRDLLDHADEMDAAMAKIPMTAARVNELVATALAAERELGDELAGELVKAERALGLEGMDHYEAVRKWKAARGRG